MLETKPEDQKLEIDKEWKREKTLEEKANEALSFIAASEKGCESQNLICERTRKKLGTLKGTKYSSGSLIL